MTFHLHTRGWLIHVPLAPWMRRSGTPWWWSFGSFLHLFLLLPKHLNVTRHLLPSSDLSSFLEDVLRNEFISAVHFSILQQLSSPYGWIDLQCLLKVPLNVLWPDVLVIFLDDGLHMNLKRVEKKKEIGREKVKEIGCNGRESAQTRIDSSTPLTFGFGFGCATEVDDCGDEDGDSDRLKSSS